MSKAPVTPDFTPEAQPFWEGTRAGKLLYQYCEDCTSIQFPFQTLCRKCLGANLSARASTGRGTIFTFSTVHRAPLNVFRSDIPYIVALIEMEEGFRLFSSLRGAREKDIRIGTMVSVVFQDYDGWSLPRFELVEPPPTALRK